VNGVLRRLPAVALVLLAASLGGAEAAELRWHWRDGFNSAEQRKLRDWVERTAAGLERVVGPLPMTVHIYFHRRSRAREPVPWAHTERSAREGVHFHVDPGFPLQAFLADWTAPHELSHLVLPYLGARHAWFAEGFASYMQYQVMQAMGVIDETQVQALYAGHLRRARRGYDRPRTPFAAAAPRLRAEGRYPVMYWGGAVYFLRVARALEAASGPALTAVLTEYLACCRARRGGLGALVARLDAIAAAPVFSRELARFRAEPGFPEAPSGRLR